MGGTGTGRYCALENLLTVVAAEVAPRKRKRKKNESTVTLKSLQPAKQIKALKKDKRLAMPLSLLPTCSGNLNNRRYLILPSLGLGSLH
jgi:hypothetical protein